MTILFLDDNEALTKNNISISEEKNGLFYRTNIGPQRFDFMQPS